MSYTYRIRGWLQIPFQDFDMAQAHILRMKEQTYDPKNRCMFGWHLTNTGNYPSAYLFYGADMNRSGFDQFLSVLKSILAFDFWSDDADLEGYFNAMGDDEDDNFNIKIVAGLLSIEETSIPLLDYN